MDVALPDEQVRKAPSGNAVQTVLPDVPHQLCHFHYLREADV
jgi:hypothetical protein